jgi:hypothetical protein
VGNVRIALGAGILTSTLRTSSLASQTLVALKIKSSLAGVADRRAFITISTAYVITGITFPFKFGPQLS